MTTRAPFTQAALRRAIKAAEKAGVEAPARLTKAGAKRLSHVEYEGWVDEFGKAAKAGKDKAPAARQRVHEYIVACRAEGATSDEVEVALHLPHQTASARVNELWNANVIRDSGRRRATRTGASAKVWVGSG